MIATDPITHWRERVLVLPGWPDGFCPVHAFTADRCHYLCVDVRLDLAEIARDLECHWQRLGYRTEVGTQ